VETVKADATSAPASTPMPAPPPISSASTSSKPSPSVSAVTAAAPAAPSAVPAAASEDVSEAIPQGAENDAGNDDLASIAGGSAELTLHDGGRNRDIPIKVYYPDHLSGSVPLIIFSPGYGGNREG